MNKYFKFLSTLLILLLAVSISCKDEDPLPADNDFQELSGYLADNNLDLGDILTNWIVGAPATEEGVPTFVAENYIIDIRSETAYNDGHIENAVNGSLTTILTDAEGANGKPIVVVCYTGQSAGHAVTALRLSGYSDARVLKFGMSGWNSNFSGSWSSNTGDAAVGHNSWKNGQLSTNSKHNGPNWEGNASTAPLMLQERVTAMLQKGFQGVSNTDVLANPSGYFINNFWASTDTDQYGHLQNAYRIYPMSLAAGDFENLDPDQTIVTYCWTGQTSSMVTAYLTVLGYEAKSLKFGVNGMIYSQLEGHKFVLPSVDLPVVTE